MVRVSSERFEPGHPAWQDDLAELDQQLRDAASSAPTELDAGSDQLVVDAHDTPLHALSAATDGGTKGLVEVIPFVAAASSSLALVIREWQRRDPDRRVTIERVEGDGSMSRVSIEGMRVRRRLLEEALRPPDDGD